MTTPSLHLINRPSFKAGTVRRYQYTKRLRENDRKGLGNRDITRQNFIAPEIKGREVIPFERLQLQDIETEGIKVQLGDKTIEKLFKVSVPDVTDVKWIEEKKRRLSLGETEEQIARNPPFSRPQRSVNKMMNFAAQGIGINNNIEMVKAAVLQGNSDSKQEQARLIANTAQILGDISALQKITRDGMTNLRQALIRMNVPKNYKAAGFKHRFFTYQQYEKQAGLINLFLLSNMDAYPDRKFEEPIHRYNLGASNYVPIGIANLLNVLKRKRNVKSKILDLRSRSVYHFEDVVPYINQGADEGKLNGQDPPEGGWKENVWPTWDFYDGRRGEARIPEVLQGKTQGAATPVPYDR